MSKFMYGVEFLREYDPRDQEHLARRSRLCELPSGPRLLPDAFDCILARVCACLWILGELAIYPVLVCLVF